jgi:hypothetical protein
MKNPSVKQAQIIQGALIAGVVIFSIAVAMIAMQTGTPAPTADALYNVRMMTYFHAIVFMGTWSASRAFGDVFAKAMTIPAGAPPEQEALTRWQAKRLFELMLREGAAFIGLAICLVGVQNGVFRERPLFWVNAMSAVLFVLSAWITFPTESSVRGTLGRAPLSPSK